MLAVPIGSVDGQDKPSLPASSVHHCDERLLRSVVGISAIPGALILDLVREDNVEHVIVRSVSRIARDMRDLYATVDEIVENGSGIHIINDGIEIAPSEEMDVRDRIFFNTFALAAELEGEMLQQRTVEGLRAAENAGKHIGRPPYGFETNDEGYLVPNEDFTQARNAIEAVDELDWSKRKAARHTGVSRRTLANHLRTQGSIFQRLTTVLASTENPVR